MDLLAGIRASSGDREALLPEPLRSLFARQRTRRRRNGILLGLGLVAAGVAVVVYNLPQVERGVWEYIVVGAGLPLLGMVAGLWGFVVRDPALWILVDEDLVWVYGHVSARYQEHNLVLASDRGLEARLRLYPEQVPLPAVFAAVYQLHPHARVGYTPELASAYARSPASLRAQGTGRPRQLVHHLYVWRRGIALALLLGGLACSSVAPLVVLAVRQGSREPLRAPRFTEIKMNAQHVTFTARAAPGVTIVAPHEVFQTAGADGATRFDLRLDDLRRWLGGGARSLAIRAYDEESSAPPMSTTLALPMSIDEAQASSTAAPSSTGAPTPPGARGTGKRTQP